MPLFECILIEYSMNKCISVNVVNTECKYISVDYNNRYRYKNR